MERYAFRNYQQRFPHPTKGVSVMIPTSLHFDQSVMTALLEHDPLVADYRAFFALFDWSLVEQ
jgi:hypothetical protein